MTFDEGFYIVFLILILCMPLFALKFEKAKWLLLVYYLFAIFMWLMVFLTSSRDLYFVLTHFDYIYPLLCCILGILSFIWFKKEFFCIKFYLFGFYLVFFLSALYFIFIAELPKNKGFYVDEDNLKDFYIYEGVRVFLSLLGFFGLYKNKNILLYLSYILSLCWTFFVGFHFST